MLCKKSYILMGLALIVLGSLAALVPPHPQYRQIPGAWEASQVEVRLDGKGALYPKQQNLPNNILVLRVQFPDLSFVSQASYPDSLAHDAEYFERWMLHLGDFFLDASHYQYELNHYLYPTVITLPHPAAYYGADSSEKIDANIAQLARDAVDMVDDVTDFSQYGGLIIFHAGAGQESDIEGIRTNEIWSTFLTRKSLQAAFDPDNDDYPGMSTNDGAHLINIVIVAEHEYQDYFPGAGGVDAEAYLFSIYGVLAHQFAHILGLPTLFDNDSSNGKSQGIGNWGLMGTGVWNASGYVPAQLCAWSRMFLGWETPVLIEHDATDLRVSHFLDHDPQSIRMYRIPISATEYFLIENRQQNPDGSLDPYNSQPSYSFKLLDEGEQEYYADAPLRPYFNFMKNRYVGSEWDFFLPGLGGPFPPGQATLQDGSGILIWHIDEGVIAQNFTANFDRNRINGNAFHKGVDLEEADGIQHLDTAVFDIYKWGSPFDAFRQGNNSYFGEAMHNGVMSLPTAESYYGGVPLEIYDIGSSSNQMSFSVRFSWRLEADYTGAGKLNAAMIDLDGDGEEELFYALPNGKLYAWKGEMLMPGFPKTKLPVAHQFSWDGNDLYLPMQYENLARLWKMNSSQGIYAFTSFASQWASHPVDAGQKVYLPITKDDGAKLFAYDKSSDTSSLELELDENFTSNLVYSQNKIQFLSKGSQEFYRLWTLDTQSGESSSLLVEVPADSMIVGLFKAPLLPGNPQQQLVVQCARSLWVMDEQGTVVSGFPFIHDAVCTAPLTMADLDQNGSLDIILGCENGLILLDYSGRRMSPGNVEGQSSEADGFSAGAIVFDIDADGKPDILGMFGNNQLKAFNSSFTLKRGYPVAFGERSRTLPLVSKAADGKRYILCVTDNGKIFRNRIHDNAPLPSSKQWLHEYANLGRTASFDPGELPNSFVTGSLFVPDELYIFPNPLKSIYGSSLTLNVMTNTDTPMEVKIFDISGKLVYAQKSYAKAYLRNREAINIPARQLQSGVYILSVKAGSQTRRLKFAVEK